MYDFALTHSYLIPLLPLIAACISGFLGAKWLRQRSHWPIWIGVGCSAVLAFALLSGQLHLWENGKQGFVVAESTVQPTPETKHDGPGMSLRHEPDVLRPESAAQPAPQPKPAVWASPTVTTWFNWASAGDPAAGGKEFIEVNAAAFIDPLTCVMLCVVCGIGLLITIFAAGYMKGEDGYWRFFAYLGLFIFAMTVLVMADNFVLMYLGWEGVGLCSYLLIGYYYQKPSAREAAKKAFLVNRIGDFGFGIGIMLAFTLLGTVSFFGAGPGTGTGLLERAMQFDPWSWQYHFLQMIPFFLMVGAFGKSAQFPLYVWLPDAMEGPTPVSALIHAATMVTAGVYMIARCSTLFFANNTAMLTVACIGTFTALFASTIALRQFDLKKVFAYSTVSQLGYMFAALGFLAPVAGVFHLITHAFFKALLFLASGVVMHAMAGELDMRKMSGLKAVLPKTRWLMLIGCFALAGFPFFSGFFSKDMIIAAGFNSHVGANQVLAVVLLIAAFITAYYTFRLYFRVFEGPLVTPNDTAHAAAAHTTAKPEEHRDDAEQKAQAEHPHGVDAHGGHGHDAHGHDAHGHGDHGHHNHEPAIMIWPLVLLAIGAVLAGYIGWPERVHDLGHFLEHSPSYVLSAGDRGESAMEGAPESPFTWVMGLSALIALGGVGLAWMLHLKNRALAETLAERFKPIVKLLDGKYWIDEVYQAAIIEPLRKIGRIFFALDRMLIDGIVWMIGFVPQAGGFVLKLTTQRGYLQGYAATMLLGVVVILLIVLCS